MGARTVVFKPRLLVCARGIEVWVRTLSYRADQGDEEAERALEKLRDAFENASKVLGNGPEMQEDQFLVVIKALEILDGALRGSREYPVDVLRGIARQADEDCRRLGVKPFDVDGFLELLGDDS